MHDENKLSLNALEQQVKELSTQRGRESSPVQDEVSHVEDLEKCVYPIPYDTGNGETSYTPTTEEIEEDDSVQLVEPIEDEDEIVETPIIDDEILDEDEDEDLLDLNEPKDFDDFSKQDEVDKEDRKFLSHAEDKSLVYYDRETLNEEERNIMLSAIEQHILTPQYDRTGNLYFNPRGIVSRAESINALERFGKKRKSIDGVSEESDYFNQGYNELVSSGLDNFFEFYTKENIYGNIRRCELAYMISSHPNYFFNKDVAVKENISKLYGYEDIKKIQISLEDAGRLYSLIQVNNNRNEDIDYYFNKVRSGEIKLPISLILLTHYLVELGYSESDEKVTNLHPLKGVSRLEFAKYIVNLKK
ncbi:hypothetical protein [Bacillus toyonensis]|uniref:hypothetical protein n=1 Tax=Bacillus toyonensis TaxID=155322 RepID=UPI000BF84A40|nr:hypothetical protein [Bacillus toyonensis]PGF05073.1 hypothetical protein COM61_01175 [Bacillus toyonensis]